MRLGDKGEAVRKLQELLSFRGYRVVADGDFGPKTEKAVKQFQKDQGLVVDGIAGPATLAALPARKPPAPTGTTSATLGFAARSLPVLSVKDRLSRAWDWTIRKSKYILGEGGRNPNNPSPLTPNKNGVLGSDCIGFVLWCLGIDRYQPKLFTYYGGWMNTDSIIADAQTGVGGKLWRLLPKPSVGCLVIFPSLHKNGKMVRMGHVGLVVEVPAEWPDDIASWDPKARREMLKLVKVIDCNASFKRKLSGKAIGLLTAADSWDKPDAVWVEFAG